LAGIIELKLRNFAEGSRSPNVPYIEAWYVKSEYRSRDDGQALIKRAESWPVEQGFKQITSDTELDNNKSIALHKHLGFLETERVVCFLKQL
jgi:aminoglycoside 6'-N-acetyltransferase I